MDVLDKPIPKTHIKDDAVYLCMTLTTQFQYKLGPPNNKKVKSRFYIYFAEWPGNMMNH